MIAPGARESAASDRRMLAAIAFADIVGYSTLMEEDETGTHSRWMAILQTVIRPKSERYSGTVVKSTGDGVLVMFTSALEAVDWAQDIQLTLQQEKSLAAPSNDIVLRIGIHIGDVIVTEDDIYGDAVNIAARLEEHATPGGIALSETVYDLVRGTAGARAIDLGLRELKNIAKPVRIFALDSDKPTPDVPARPWRSSLPSIAVLPFENLGPGPSDDYFTDGIVEDVIVSLAGLGELFVISRGSTLKFRGPMCDPRDIGRALGVRYVLTGSIRMAAGLVRVTTQLCDASSGGNVWSETTQAPLGELFDVQDRIVARVVAGIAPNVRAAELRRAIRKRPESFSAYDLTLRALSTINELDRDSYGQALQFLLRATQEDPYFAMPFAWAALWHLLNVGQGWSVDPNSDIEKAGTFASRAIELDPRNALALSVYGHVKSFLFHQCEAGLYYLDQALDARPNSPHAWLFSSATLSYLGQGEKAVRHAEQGLRLSPFDRSIFLSHNILCIAHYANGCYSEAIKWGQLSREQNPTFTANHRILLASLVAAGERDQARAIAEELMQLEPNFRVGEWERTRQPFQAPELRAKHVERLRMAGLPE